MRKFKVVICALKTLEVVRTEIVEARNVDSARELGIVKYSQPGYFVGAQNI